jgi:hypothetical protein
MKRYISIAIFHSDGKISISIEELNRLVEDGVITEAAYFRILAHK